MIEECFRNKKIEGVAGAILAGGQSSRMGRNKALLEVAGIPIVTRVYQVLAGLFNEVLVVTNSPAEYSFLPCRKVPDIYPGCGSIAGLHSALANSGTRHVFVTACDLPFLDPVVIRRLSDFRDAGDDAVVPLTEAGQEPLHAIYSSVCSEIFGGAIRRGELKILDVLGNIKVRYITSDEVQNVGNMAESFLNVNTPEEYSGIKLRR